MFANVTCQTSSLIAETSRRMFISSFCIVCGFLTYIFPFNAPHRKPPAKQTIANVVKKLEMTGCVLDIHACGKPPMSDETVADVKQRLEQSPKKYLRRLSQETSLTYSTCQRAAKEAKLKAYRVTVVQELKPLDTKKRVAYCEWFQNVFGERDELLDITWYTDEEWFHLSGYVNSQITPMWATEHPYAIHEVPLHSEKTGVWCAKSRCSIVGPIISHDTLNTCKSSANL
jgi:hypothetical protein